MDWTQTLCGSYRITMWKLQSYLYRDLLLRISIGLRSTLVARHALQLRHVDPIQDHRQLAGSQLHRARSRIHPRQLERSRFQSFVSHPRMHRVQSQPHVLCA